MPAVPFSSLPDDARLWVFASAEPLDADAAARLLAEVDAFLETWAAHGDPLRAGREWRDDRFLAIGVDQSTAGASGCSIDGLFRRLAALEPALGTTMLGGASRVYWRDADGRVHAADRPGARDLARAGAWNADSPVFDLGVTTAGDWRRRFERAARDSWHAALL
jgi:hypothetical protein